MGRRNPFNAQRILNATERALLPQRKFTSDEMTAIENVTCTQQTPKAILCDIDDEPVWIPQSQVHDDSEVWKVGDEGTLVVTTWFAKKAGLV